MESSNWIQTYYELLNRPRRQDMQIQEALELRDRYLPVSLYRYRSFDADGYSVKNLQDRVIWLNSPLNFNDPFDSVLSLSADILFQEGFAQNVSALLTEPPWDTTLDAGRKETILKSLDPFRTFAEIAVKLSNDTRVPFELQVEILLSTIQKEHEETEDQLNQTLRDNLSVCCFSEKDDSVLMWSLYSERHTGFCVEYSTWHMRPPDEIGFIHPVNYRKDLIDVTAYFRSSIRNGRLDPDYNNWMATIASCHKSPEWAYEKEWRYIFPGKRATIPMPAQKIIMGARISSENRAKLLAIAKEQRIRILECSLARPEFKLQITPFHDNP